MVKRAILIRRPKLTSLVFESPIIMMIDDRAMTAFDPLVLQTKVKITNLNQNASELSIFKRKKSCYDFSNEQKQRSS